MSSMASLIDRSKSNLRTHQILALSTYLIRHKSTISGVSSTNRADMGKQFRANVTWDVSNLYIWCYNWLWSIANITDSYFKYFSCNFEYYIFHAIRRKRDKIHKQTSKCPALNSIYCSCEAFDSQDTHSTGGYRTSQTESTDMSDSRFPAVQVTAICEGARGLALHTSSPPKSPHIKEFIFATRTT